MNRMEELGKGGIFLFCGIRIFPHTPLYDLAVEEGQIRPDQDLLSPVFYRSKGIDNGSDHRQGQKAGARPDELGLWGRWGRDGADRDPDACPWSSRPLWELLLR